MFVKSHFKVLYFLLLGISILTFGYISRYVLTAAHCLEDPKRRKKGRLLVRLGDRDWTR